MLKYYSKTISPEESLIQTVLVNSGQFNICNDDKRYLSYLTICGIVFGKPGNCPAYRALSQRAGPFFG